MNGRAVLPGLDFLKSPIFLSALWSLLTAQFIKAIINLLKYRSYPFRELLLTFLWRTGGMPSSHSALAVSVATAIGIVEGTGSSLFILSLVFALVVIRDAMGVRRSSGLQAHALNQLGKKLSARLSFPFHPVKEILGHSPAQVIVGSVLGFFIALAFCTL